MTITIFDASNRQTDEEIKQLGSVAGICTDCTEGKNFQYGQDSLDHALDWAEPHDGANHNVELYQLLVGATTLRELKGIELYPTGFIDGTRRNR